MRRYLILILSMAMATGCAKKEGVAPTPTGPTIVGVVKSEGKPLEGVTVSIEALGISSTTGADGSFKMTDLVEGVYKVSFEKEGYVKKEVEVTVGAEGTVNIGEVVLELSGSIEGVAKIEGEDVHKGIKVRVMELGGLEVETDSEGRYAITGIPPGTYTLKIFFTEESPVQVTVDVEPGKVAKVEEVTVKKPVRKVILRVIGGRTTDYTDSKGNIWYSLQNPYPTLYEKYGVKGGYIGTTPLTAQAANVVGNNTGYDDEIFKACSWNWSQGPGVTVMAFQFDVPNGKYEIVHLYGEHWSPKNRNMWIDANGKRVLDEWLSPGQDEVKMVILKG